LLTDGSRSAALLSTVISSLSQMSVSSTQPFRSFFVAWPFLFLYSFFLPFFSATPFPILCGFLFLTGIFSPPAGFDRVFFLISYRYHYA